jgi:hypothetical protein
MTAGLAGGHYFLTIAISQDSGKKKDYYLFCHLQWTMRWSILILF